MEYYIIRSRIPKSFWSLFYKFSFYNEWNIPLEIHYCFDNFHNDIHAPFHVIDRCKATESRLCPSTRIQNAQRRRNPWPWHHRLSFRSSDSTTTNDENSCARVNHVSADIFIQRGDRTVGWNETKEEAQAELHNATRETQEWKKPLVVGKWPWARYRSVFGHDGFIVEIYTLYTPLRIVISKVERISRGVLIYIYIYIYCAFRQWTSFPREKLADRLLDWFVKGCVELERTWITHERKELNGNPFSSVYDSRCYELWRGERNVYFLAWRCNNLGEEWLIVLFLQTMYLVLLGIFSPWDVLWPCFILNFCFAHLLLLLTVYRIFITVTIAVY